MFSLPLCFFRTFTARGGWVRLCCFPTTVANRHAVNTMARYLFDEAEGLSDIRILTLLCMCVIVLFLWDNDFTMSKKAHKMFIQQALTIEKRLLLFVSILLFEKVHIMCLVPREQHPTFCRGLHCQAPQLKERVGEGDTRSGVCLPRLY